MKNAKLLASSCKGLGGFATRRFRHTYKLAASSSKLSRGFTLVELLVVMGIMTLISALMFANNAKFGGQVQLQNLAYDIALSIRQSQVYGISVQRFGDSGREFASAYGMHFKMSSPNTYQLFADRVGTVNGRYDSASGELLQNATMQSGYAISALCTVDPALGSSCEAVDELNITFRRPDPDAYIAKDDVEFYFDARGRLSPAGQNVQSQARITVVSPRGDTKQIVVFSSGQIAVQATQ